MTFLPIRRLLPSLFGCVVLTFASARCGSTDTNTGSAPLADLAGQWTGTCELTTLSDTITFALTSDAAGQISGQLTDTALGSSGTVSGTFDGSNLSATYSYPGGSGGTAKGTLTSSAAGTYTGTLNITPTGGSAYPASCSFTKTSSDAG